MKLGSGLDTRYPNFQFWSLSAFKFLNNHSINTLVESYLSRKVVKKDARQVKLLDPAQLVYLLILVVVGI